MYARLLFVVVGILGPLLARLAAFPQILPHVLPTAVLDPRLGFPGGCGYTLAA
jgi:hypothetical protein